MKMNTERLIWRWVAVFGLVGLGFFSVIVLRGPRHYTAEATLLMAPLLMAPLPGETSPNVLSAQFVALKNNLLSEDMLTEIVRGLDLYPRKRAQSLHKILGEMRGKDLKIALSRVHRDALVFSIACRNDDPAKATGTVKWLVNALMTDSNGQKRSWTGVKIEIVNVPDLRRVAFISTWP